MPAPRGAREDTTVEWVFDPLPASGARRGGDPASHVFRQSVSTFVREVVQNANDQRVDAPEVHFRFYELSGNSLAEFRRAIAWDTLEPHLVDAAATKGGRALGAFLAEHRRRDRLIALVIEDRNTVGLTGDEMSGDSHFRALCKDTLFSHKQTDSAGGSYGLGKSILWAFSGLSTVLFYSVLSEDPSGQRSPRLFGRAELPSHDGFAGSGWFGRRVATPGGARAESVWNTQAMERADALRTSRSLETFGTSILILGFRDPTAESDRSPDELAQEIRRSVEREFWPAIMMPATPLVVWVAAGRPSPILPRDFVEARPFAEAFQRRDSDRQVLENPGDVVVREIPIEVPARRDGAPAVTGTVRLCVRLFEENALHPRAGHVAWFRGPGMVVRYTDRRSLAIGARPFHAVVACGLARSPESPTLADHAVEVFLRAAEPPGHDVWDSTPSLKSDYKLGYQKALTALKQRVDAALKEIVIAQPRRGKQGPDRLRKRFPLGQKGGRGGAPSAFRFGHIAGRFENGRWCFQAEVRPSEPVPRWRCTLRLAEVGEDGTEVRGVAIETLSVSSGSATLVDGVARVDLDVPVLRFEGRSVAYDRVSITRAVQLELRGDSEV
jgi:hypothetical protein